MGLLGTIGSLAGGPIGGLVGGAVDAGLSFAGSMSASAKQYQAQQNANQMNLQIMREQMAFQRENAQNAHQWEVEDLRKAGLNPILSATGGSGASVGSVPSPNMVSPGGHLSENAVSTAKLLFAEINKARAEVATQKTQQALNKELKFKAAVDAGTSAQLGVKAAEDAKTQASVRAVNTANALKMSTDTKAQAANAAFYSSGYGKALKYIGQTTGAFGNIFGGVRDYTSFKERNRAKPVSKQEHTTHITKSKGTTTIRKFIK